MRRLIFALSLTLIASPSMAKEKEFIEMAALMGVFRDVCHAPVSDDAILTAVGSAMIKYALPRDQVLARATKRGAHIQRHVVETRTQHTFCEAVKYYLDNGYPR